MSNTHNNGWRGLSNSEVKSAGGADPNSTRAYSAAVRVLKPKGASSSNVTSNGIIVPKVQLKKKSPNNNSNQMTI